VRTRDEHRAKAEQLLADVEARWKPPESITETEWKMMMLVLARAQVHAALGDAR
jgi:hypothetical protein